MKLLCPSALCHCTRILLWAAWLPNQGDQPLRPPLPCAFSGRRSTGSAHSPKLHTKGRTRRVYSSSLVQTKGRRVPSCVLMLLSSRSWPLHPAGLASWLKSRCGCRWVPRRPASARVHTSCPCCPATQSVLCLYLPLMFDSGWPFPTSVLNASLRSLKRALSLTLNPSKHESTNSWSPPFPLKPRQSFRIWRGFAFLDPGWCHWTAPSCSCNPYKQALRIALEARPAFLWPGVSQHVKHVILWHLKHVIFLLLLPRLSGIQLKPGSALVLAKLMRSCFISS